MYKRNQKRKKKQEKSNQSTNLKYTYHNIRLVRGEESFKLYPDESFFIQKSLAQFLLEKPLVS